MQPSEADRRTYTHDEPHELLLLAQAASFSLSMVSIYLISLLKMKKMKKNYCLGCVTHEEGLGSYWSHGHGELALAIDDEGALAI